MKEFSSKCDFITLTKKEADILRAGIQKEYVKMGGEKALGKASLKIYDDLRDSFKNKFSDTGFKLSYMDKSGAIHHDVQEPGASFLKSLFYLNKDKQEEQHNQYQVDLCYLYAFGIIREAYRKLPKKDEKIATPPKAIVEFRFVISSINSYSSEIEEVKLKIESWGFSTDKDIRDIRYLSIGSLPSFFENCSEGVMLVLLIGKNYLHNETQINELIDVKNRLQEVFLRNSVIILLPDICDGENNVNNPTGIHKINEFWNEQLEYMEDAIPKMSSESRYETEELVQKANDDRRNLQLIISEMNSVVEVLRSARMAPFTHFMNHFSMDELGKLLSCPVSKVSQRKKAALAERKKELSKLSKPTEKNKEPNTYLRRKD